MNDNEVIEIENDDDEVDLDYTIPDDYDDNNFFAWQCGDAELEY